MTRTKFVAAILIAVLSPAAPGIAQQAEPAEPQPPENGDQQQAETETPPPASNTVSDDSPYDYRASEEISEDLSVSFPVDI